MPKRKGYREMRAIQRANREKAAIDRLRAAEQAIYAAIESVKDARSQFDQVRFELSMEDTLEVALDALDLARDTRGADIVSSVVF